MTFSFSLSYPPFFLWLFNFWGDGKWEANIWRPTVVVKSFFKFILLPFDWKVWFLFGEPKQNNFILLLEFSNTMRLGGVGNMGRARKIFFIGISGCQLVWSPRLRDGFVCESCIRPLRILSARLIISLIPHTFQAHRVCYTVSYSPCLLFREFEGACLDILFDLLSLIWYGLTCFPIILGYYSLLHDFLLYLLYLYISCNLFMINDKKYIPFLVIV